MKKSFSGRSAFALTDLLIATTSVAILGALLLPVMQEMREAARNAACNENLMQLGVDAVAYHDAFNRLPCQLGAAGAVDFDSWRFYPTSDVYYGKQQSASPIAMAAHASGRLEELTGQPEPIDPVFWDFDSQINPFFLDLNGWSELSVTNAPFFRCPSMQFFLPTEHYYLAFQPALPANSDNFGQLPISNPNAGFGITNYVGCLGANSGGSNRTPEYAEFRGMITTRERLTFDDVIAADGLSQTIMYGENIGQQERDPITDIRFNESYQVWLTGAVARGRGVFPWMQNPPPGSTLLGKTGASSIVGFGAVHREGVGFVFGDGHTENLAREIDWQVLYQKCGAFDGNDN